MLAAVLLALVTATAPATTPPKRPPSTPFARVQQARLALETGRYDLVLEIVDGLLAEYPRSQSSHLLRALALDELGRRDEATKAFEAAIAIAPNDPQIQARYGMHFVRRGAWTSAIPLLERSLSAEEDALTLFYLAQALFQTQSRDMALEAMERCVVLAPDNPTMLLKLGEYRAKMGTLSPALEALLRVETLNPKEPGLNAALGNVYLSLLEVEKARAALERALAADPGNPAVLSSLASACSKGRDHEAARRYYKQLLDLGLDEGEYHLGLGEALVGLGDNEAAIVELNEAAKRNPRLEEVHFHLARAYRATGRAEDAQRELVVFKALKASPFRPMEDRSDFERNLWRRAEELLREGKESDALRLLSTGNAPDIEPSYLAGALYYSLGMYADAERLLTEALRTKPDLPKLRAYLGLSKLEQGRLDEAASLIAEEATRVPNEPLVLMAQGQLHFRGQQWAEALRSLQASRVVDTPILLLVCEAQLRLGQRAQARETARVIKGLAIGRADTLLALENLLGRLDGGPAPDAASGPRPSTSL